MRSSPVSPWCRRAARAAAIDLGEVRRLSARTASGRRQADAAVGTGNRRAPVCCQGSESAG